MTLTPDQITELKNQLSQQIKDLPDQQKAAAQAQIDGMSSDDLEALIQQQNNNSIFRLIAKKEVDSIIIEEKDNAIAVLDINPISKGHTLIIPKEQVLEKEQLPKEIVSFSAELSTKIKNNLNPKAVHVSIDKKLGEVVIDLIPEYETPVNPSSPRQKVEREELEKIANEINILKVENKIEKIEIKNENKDQDPIKKDRRVP